MVKKMKRVHPLLDAIIAKFDLGNDAHLADFLKVYPAAVSKLRNGKNAISGDTILNIYDKTGWSIERIRALLQENKHD
jgi:plasmid maintenance system antidote protein VapI